MINFNFKYGGNHSFGVDLRLLLHNKDGNYSGNDKFAKKSLNCL